MKIDSDVDVVDYQLAGFQSEFIWPSFFVIRHVWHFVSFASVSTLFNFNDGLRNFEFKIHYKSILAFFLLLN